MENNSENCLNTQNSNKKNIPRKSKIVLMCCIIIGIILIITTLFITLSFNTLSESEQYAIDMVSDLLSRMKVPDTFILQGDILILTDPEDISITYTFIDYSAENSFGVPLRDRAVYSNYDYMGSYYDIESKETPETWEYETHTEWEIAMEKYLTELYMLKTFNGYQVIVAFNGGQVEGDGAIFVDCKQIAKTLNIEYQK